MVDLHKLCCLCNSCSSYFLNPMLFFKKRDLTAVCSPWFVAPESAPRSLAGIVEFLQQLILSGLVYKDCL